MLNRNVVPWTERWKREGFEEGVLEGIEKGVEKGIEKGVEKGRQEQTRLLVRRQLARRFGSLSEGIEARLAVADLAQLEAYADRLLDAPTLDAVFLEG